MRVACGNSGNGGGGGGEGFNLCCYDEVQGYHYPFTPIVYQTVGVYATYLPKH